jgi:glucose-6-phosphate isomerase
MKNMIEIKEWQALSQHQQEIAGQHMREWFTKDQQRFARFNIQAGEILLDYSRNRISEQTIHLLCELAQAAHLPQKIAALFSGNPVNVTENRPALHSALRDPKPPAIFVKGENISTLITENRDKMRHLVSAIHNGKWTGASGKPIRHIVNVGIGGSHLGAMMSTQALKEFAQGNLDFHFISSVDDNQLNETLQKIDAETALFIISSKSFTTIETLTNAHSLAEWIKNKLGQAAIKKHFLAITACPQKALEFGIDQNHILPIWDWIGGRYSIWSAIGLPLMLMIGNQRFDEFLQGAHEMDQHFRKSEFKQNMPVLMAMLGVWYVNFFHANAQAIVPYTHRLRYFIPYLQQVGMESNGKRTSLNGRLLPYATGPVLFGEEGCNGQHAYHQLLHQGQHLIPVDFIMVGNAGAELNQTHQDILIASCLSQAQALMHGKTQEESYAELVAENIYSPEQIAQLALHKMIPGNKPSNILFLPRITPKNLGALIALYEHKIFVQSAIWDINAFDQWGIELGKQLLPNILKQIQDDENNQDLNSPMTALIRHVKNAKNKARV